MNVLLCMVIGHTCNPRADDPCPAPGHKVTPRLRLCCRRVRSGCSSSDRHVPAPPVPSITGPCPGIAPLGVWLCCRTRDGRQRGAVRTQLTRLLRIYIHTLPCSRRHIAPTADQLSATNTGNTNPAREHVSRDMSARPGIFTGRQPPAAPVAHYAAACTGLGDRETSPGRG